MLYWKDDVDLEYCKFCGDARNKPTRGQDPCQKKSPYAVLWYLPLTPRLQRLYSSRSTTEHMTWHATYQTEEGSMCHPSDAEARKHFDQMYPDFAEEPRNVWLGLCTDDFMLHASDRCVLGIVNRRAAAVVACGVRTYVHATDNEFIMHATLMNDLPAYGMASGWSTARVMGCPTKKSIFWDIPYWSTLLIRHNLDVMHIEKNIFDNIFNTVMDIKEKMKDNLNARWDLKSICNRPELELDECRPNIMPKAVYTLSKEQKRRELLPEHIWSALTGVSLLFKSICSTTLDVHKLHELENSVAIILCNLEKIFPPAFFDSMEYLIIHLPYEARVGGPMQFRWMYPFERFLCELKKKVKNKAHVEASIVEAYKLWTTIRLQILHEVRRVKLTMITKTMMKPASRTTILTMMNTN
ncbi:UNVERIFIED_CONTAM: hypothetical protein Slati_1344500 [Sesamum latifolium]|uniref:DUF4218 domain-containing protein n=1 Tax=Sesamum latifolium TaxID=2727402 RepID=A0AAW2XHT8_9LAMI